MVLLIIIKGAIKSLRVKPDTSEPIILYSVKGFPESLSELISLLNRMIGEDVLPDTVG
jgi:hypothetical protein